MLTTRTARPLLVLTKSLPQGHAMHRGRIISQCREQLITPCEGGLCVSSYKLARDTTAATHPHWTLVLYTGTRLYRNTGLVASISGLVFPLLSIRYSFRYIFRPKYFKMHEVYVFCESGSIFISIPGWQTWGGWQIFSTKFNGGPPSLSCTIIPRSNEFIQPSLG